MIVEFIGTPGAGKTSLLPVVSEHFAARGYQAFSVLDAARPFAGRTLAGKLSTRLTPRKLHRPLLWQLFYRYSFFYRMKFYRRNRVLMRSVLNFQKQRPISAADREHVLHWFIHLTGTYEFLKAQAFAREVLLFDEGFVHRVVQLFASEKEAPDFERVAAYLDLIPRPDLVICPQAPYELCEKRVYARGLWDRFRVKTPAETSAFIANAYSVVNFAVGYLKDQGWRVIEIENGEQEISIAQSALRGELMQLSI